MDSLSPFNCDAPTDIGITSMDTVASAWDKAVNRFSERIAVSWRGGQLTYAELDAISGGLAAQLRIDGLAVGECVAFCFPRGIESVVAALAVLRAGGAYLPLSLNQSATDWKRQTEGARVQRVITEPERVSFFKEQGFRGLALTREEWPSSPDFTSPELSPQTPAYVLFTSGSTGVPKGVVVPHAGIVRLVCLPDYVTLTPKDVIPLFAPLAFDASTLEIWGAWLNGGRLWVPEHDPVSLEELCRDMAEQSVTTLWLTAGLFNVVVDHRLEAFRGVRQVLTGGEAMSPVHARRFLEAHPNVALINGYGPTENTTFSACHRVTAADLDQPRISIGRGIRGTDTYVVDEQGHLVQEVGREGELWVGGAGLALGYANDPELTAKKFPTVSWPGVGSCRVYRTGDRVAWRADGNLEFFGRLDSQVKVRGYRLELSEIDAALAGHPSVASAASFTRPAADGHLTLLAAVVLRPGAVASDESLRAHCAAQLPTYAHPAVFVRCEALPLNANGKIDRKALADRGADALLQEQRRTTPVGPREKLLWEIWSGLLPVGAIETDQSFFDLGGDSLLAMRMLAEVESRAGVALAADLLLTARTIQALAPYLEKGRTSKAVQRVTRLTQRVSRPLVFCHGDFIHAGMGCRALAEELSDTFSFFAVNAHGFGETHLPNTLTEMAEQNVAEVLQHLPDPEEPIWLGGHCNGALVVMHLAQALEAKGRRVAGLLLLEPPSFFYPRLRRSAESVFASLGLSRARAEFVSISLIRSLIAGQEARVRRRRWWSPQFLKPAWFALTKDRENVHALLPYYQKLCNDFVFPRSTFLTSLILVGNRPRTESLRALWSRVTQLKHFDVIRAKHSTMMSTDASGIAACWRTFVSETAGQPQKVRSDRRG